MRNDFGQAKPKYSENNRPQCHFANNKTHMRWRCFNTASKKVTSLGVAPNHFNPLHQTNSSTILMLTCHRGLGLENVLLLSYLHAKIVYEFIIISISALETISV
jgi:hypothetical protein